MDVKEMREKLKPLGTVPRSNKDVVTLYNETFNQSERPMVEVAPKCNPPDNTYTYIGGGFSAPQIINFMGLQVFAKGKPTKVTHPDILAKINGNPCFRKGAVDEEVIFQMDEDSRKLYQRNLDEDVKTQIMAERESRRA